MRGRGHHVDDRRVRRRAGGLHHPWMGLALDILAFAAYLVARAVWSAFVRLMDWRPWAVVALAVRRLRRRWGGVG